MTTFGESEWRLYHQLKKSGMTVEQIAEEMVKCSGAAKAVAVSTQAVSDVPTQTPANFGGFKFEFDDLNGFANGSPFVGTRNNIDSSLATRARYDNGNLHEVKSKVGELDERVLAIGNSVDSVRKELADARKAAIEAAYEKNDFGMKVEELQTALKFAEKKMARLDLALKSRDDSDVETNDVLRAVFDGRLAGIEAKLEELAAGGNNSSAQTENNALRNDTNSSLSASYDTNCSQAPPARDDTNNANIVSINEKKMWGEIEVLKKRIEDHDERIAAGPQSGSDAKPRVATVSDIMVKSYNNIARKMTAVDTDVPQLKRRVADVEILLQQAFGQVDALRKEVQFLKTK